jgi:hypothetical protein
MFATAQGELRNCQIGPVTKATAIYLRHELKLSYRAENLNTAILPDSMEAVVCFRPSVADSGIHQTITNGWAMPDYSMKMMFLGLTPFPLFY